MKVYIHTDLEGVAGVVFFENSKTASSENPAHRQRMRKLLTAEVNAAVQAAYAAGAETVVVNDNHGGGYNLVFEELDARCEIIHGRPTNQPWLPALDGGWDALVLVGMHAMAGTPDALLAHTKWAVNGGQMTLSEASMAAALAGDHGVPAVFVSGDNRLVEEVCRKIPAIESVVVKQALGPYMARSRIPARACEMIYAGVKQALARRAAIPPFRIPGPVTLNLLESKRGNHDQREGFQRALPEDVKADTLNEAFMKLLARMPWFTYGVTLPDGFEYP